MNNIAYIDLTNQKVTVKEIPLKLRRLFLGGRGINMYLLYNHVKKGVAPLSPENALIFGAGLLTGMHVLAASRYNVSGRSPHSGLIGDSNAGGFFGPELRYAGFDHLVVTGKAAKPVYLFMRDGKIEFRDATHLTDLNTTETFELLRQESGDPQSQMAIIGPAGRRQVPLANVMNSINNANGHTGMGAVMGSKNLWAIVVRGTETLPVRDPDALYKVFDKQYKQVLSRKGFKANAFYGTLMRMSLMRTQMTMAGHNYQFNAVDLGEEMDIENFMDNYEYAKASCFNCPQHTKHIHVVKSGPHKGMVGGGPEFAAAGGFSATCGATDWDTVLECWDLCNQYGIDGMYASQYIAWAMELYQRGFIDEKVTGGLSLRWGDHHAMTELIHGMGRKEGFGGFIAEGWRAALTKLFGEAAPVYERYVPMIKGEPMEGNFKGMIAQALGAATATRGSCHLRSRYTLEEFSLPSKVVAEILGREVNPDPDAYEGKAWPVIWSENLCAVGDALGICRFLSKWMTPGFLAFDEFAEVINAATDLNLTPAQVMECGERIWNIERMFLAREGLGRKDDKLGERCFDEPWTHGARKGQVMDKEKFYKQLDEYYQLHGWDDNGHPTKETLKRLEVDKEPSHLL